MFTKLKLIVLSAVIIVAGFATTSASAAERYFRPAIGDVRTDLSGPERAVTTAEGGITVYAYTGALASGWPLSINGVVVSSPVLADINGDTLKEIVFVGRDSFNIYTIYAYDGNKNLLASVALTVSTIVYYDPIALLNSSGYDDVVISTTAGDVILFHYSNNTFAQSVIFTVGKSAGLTAQSAGQEIVVNYPNSSALSVYAKNGSAWQLNKSITLTSPIVYPVLYNSQTIFGIDKVGRLIGLNRSTGAKISTKYPLAFSSTPIDSPYWAEVDSKHAGLELILPFADGSVKTLDIAGNILSSQVYKDKSFLKNTGNIFDVYGAKYFSALNNYSNQLVSSAKRTISSIFSRQKFEEPVVIMSTSTVLPVTNAALVVLQTSTLITWDTYVDSNNNFDHFNIYRGNSINTSFVTSTLLAQSFSLTTTAFTDTLVQPGETYYYAVKAVNKSGQTSSNNWLGPAIFTSVSSSTQRILYIPFNETVSTTSFADISGNGLYATCVGVFCPQSGIMGKNNNAVSFDGIDDYLSIISTSTLSPQKAISIEAWVFPTTAPTETNVQTIATKNFKYELDVLNDGRLRVGITNSSGVRKANSSPVNSVTNNQWNHIIMTYDGMWIKGYVNGKLVISFNQSGYIQPTPQALSVGGALPTGNRFHGKIDELKIYNRALPALEVFNNYIEGVGDHLLYLPFDELTSSTSFIDLMGNGNNGYCIGSSCPQTGIVGKLGNAVAFDGIDDVVSVNSNNATLNPQKAVTIEAWVYPTMNSSENNVQMIATKNYKIEMSITVDGRLRVGITNASSTRKVPNSPINKVVNNQWNHLVLTYDGAIIKGFVNGKLVVSAVHTGDIQYTFQPLTMGSALQNYYRFHGQIDELNIYAIALSDADVLTKYQLY